MLATQLHKPYHEINLHKTISFIAHVKYIICYYKKQQLKATMATPLLYIVV